jgi:hypothetical protein
VEHDHCARALRHTCTTPICITPLSLCTCAAPQVVLYASFLIEVQASYQSGHMQLQVSLPHIWQSTQHMTFITFWYQLVWRCSPLLKIAQLCLSFPVW